MFFNKPYFMEPQKGGDKAFILLRDALKTTEKIGIAKVVIRTRQYLAAVKPHEEALVLELMHFCDEIGDVEDLKIPDGKTSAKNEMTMAKQLIESMTTKWDPEKYGDDYREALMQVIEEKIESGGKEVKSSGKRRTKPTNVIDLVSVLQQSLDEKKTAPKKPASRPAKSGSTSSRSKAAPSRKAASSSKKPASRGRSARKKAA